MRKGWFCVILKDKEDPLPPPPQKKTTNIIWEKQDKLHIPVLRNAGCVTGSRASPVHQLEL